MAADIEYTAKRKWVQWPRAFPNQEYVVRHFLGSLLFVRLVQYIVFCLSVLQLTNVNKILINFKIYMAFSADILRYCV